MIIILLGMKLLIESIVDNENNIIIRGENTQYGDEGIYYLCMSAHPNM